MISPDLRETEYLRVAVNEGCNAQCLVCQRQSGACQEEPAHWLSHGETARLVGLFARLGMGRIRLTGGEPLLRSGLVDLVSRLSRTPGVNELSLATTGFQLAHHLNDLKLAGLNSLSINLHSRNPECRARLTGVDGVGQLAEGLSAARKIGFSSIKASIVLPMEGSNAAIQALADLVLGEGRSLRLVEPVPGRISRPGGDGPDILALIEDLASKHGLLPASLPYDQASEWRWRNPVSGADLEVASYRLPSSHVLPAPLLLTAAGLMCRPGKRNVHLDLGAMLRSGSSDAGMIAAIHGRIRPQEKPPAPRDVLLRTIEFVA